MATRRTFLGSLAVTGIAGGFQRYGRSVVAGNTRRFPHMQVDVFTSRRLEGNALAVFPDATGLSDTEMQDLARETNLQETTFVFPRDAVTEREQGVKVRIFTTDQELPFGGHPALGTAMVLRKRGKEKDRVVLDLKVGKVPVVFEEGSGGVFGEMHQVGPVFGQVHERSAIAQFIGLRESDLVDVPIQTVNTGVRFATVGLKESSALTALKVDWGRVREYVGGLKERCEFYFVTPDTKEQGVRMRARFLFPSGEDAATGSAAGSAAAWMVKYGLAKPEERVQILQGVEMKRPSHMYVRAGRRGEEVVDVRVGGQVVEVMEGMVTL